jgi:membrane glycosyltransferase
MNIKIEFKWAVIFSVMTLVWMLLEKTMGWHDENIASHFYTTLLFLPLAIFMFILAIREKRRRFYAGKISWRKAFLSGALLSFFIALLSPFVQYITHNYITPEYFGNVIDYSVTNKVMTIETANNYFNIKSYMLQSAFGALFGGVGVSAILAFIMKR